eukprot:10682762-Karenia_brevis.AAC.1
MQKWIFIFGRDSGRHLVLQVYFLRVVQPIKTLAVGSPPPVIVLNCSLPLPLLELYACHRRDHGF